MKRLLLALLCAALLFLSASCARKEGALELVKKVSANFDFKYGAVYSDEYGEWSEFCFSPEMKELVFGANAPKYTYLRSVSGYFSRDMVSGAEFIAAELSDRSKREEITAVFYRRAAKKTDTNSSVWCEDNFVFFICHEKAAEIIEYLKREIG